MIITKIRGNHWVELQNFNFLKIASKWLRTPFYLQYFQKLSTKSSIGLWGDFSKGCHLHFKLSLLILTLWCSWYLPGSQHILTVSECQKLSLEPGPWEAGPESWVYNQSVLWHPLSSRRSILTKCLKVLSFLLSEPRDWSWGTTSAEEKNGKYWRGKEDRNSWFYKSFSSY